MNPPMKVYRGTKEVSMKVCDVCKNEVTIDEKWIMAGTNIGNYTFCGKCSEKIRRFLLCMALAESQGKDVDFHVED